MKYLLLIGAVFSMQAGHAECVLGKTEVVQMKYVNLDYKYWSFTACMAFPGHANYSGFLQGSTLHDFLASFKGNKEMEDEIAKVTGMTFAKTLEAIDTYQEVNIEFVNQSQAEALAKAYEEFAKKQIAAPAADVDDVKSDGH